MNRNTSSYLSSSVRHLLRLSFENCRDTSLNNQAVQCLRKEGQVLVFEDQPIQFLLGNVIIDDYSERTKEWYKVVLRRLSPLFNLCHEMLMREDFTEDIINNERYKGFFEGSNDTGYDTRLKQPIKVPFCKTDRYRNSAIPYMSRLLNEFAARNK